MDHSWYTICDAQTGERLGKVHTKGVLQTEDAILRNTLKDITDNTGSVPAQVPETLQKKYDEIGDVRWIEPGAEVYISQLSKLLPDDFEFQSSVEKDWVEYEGPRGGEGWQHTDSGEVRYQEEKPTAEDTDSGEEETTPEEEPSSPRFDDLADESDESEIFTQDGKRIKRTSSVDDVESDDTVKIGDDLYRVDEVGRADDTPLLDSDYLRITGEDGKSYTVPNDRVSGVVLGSTFETGDYEVDAGSFGAELAHGVITGELNDSSEDGFINVRELQHNLASVESTELLVDALRYEKDNRNSKTAVGRFKSRLRQLGMTDTEITEAITEGKEGEEGEDGGDDGEIDLNDLDLVEDYDTLSVGDEVIIDPSFTVNVDGPWRTTVSDTSGLLTVSLPDRQTAFYLEETGENDVYRDTDSGSTGSTGEEGSGGEGIEDIGSYETMGDEEVRRVINSLYDEESPSRREIYDVIGTPPLNDNVYMEDGLDLGAMTSASSELATHYDTISEFESAVESDEFIDDVADEYRLMGGESISPDDISGDVRDAIEEDVRQHLVFDLIQYHEQGRTEELFSSTLTDDLESVGDVSLLSPGQNVVVDSVDSDYYDDPWESEIVGVGDRSIQVKNPDGTDPFFVSYAGDNDLSEQLYWQDGEKPDSDDYYPSDTYSSPVKELEGESFVSTMDGSTSYIGKRDVAERIANNISTEELEEFVESRASTRDYAHNDKEKGLWWGVLAAREDSDWGVEDVVTIEGRGRGETESGRTYGTQDMIDQVEEAVSQMSDLDAGKTLARLQRMQAKSIGPSGRYYSLHEKIENDKDSVRDAAVAVHEFGHAWQYSSGVTGSAGRDNRKRHGEDVESWSADFTVPFGVSDDDRPAQMADAFEREWERYKTRYKKTGPNAELRSYQRTNANEFMAVSFAHYHNDKAKMRYSHPELEVLYDRFVGGGIDSEEVEYVGVDPFLGDVNTRNREVEEDDRVIADLSEEVTSQYVGLTTDEIRNGKIIDIENNGPIDQLQPENIVYTFLLSNVEYKVSADNIESMEKLQ